MKPLTSIPEPDLKIYKSSCDIDFVRFFSSTTKTLSISPYKIKVRPLHAHGHKGMLVTIQDPQPSDLLTVAKELPEAIFDAIEVYFDLTPKDQGLTLPQHHAHIEEVRQWLISHLYPWEAVGLQVATRVSSGKRHCEPVLSGDVERRAKKNETMYLGHSDSIYADPDEPNFASMRLYRKVTDNRMALPPNKHKCRLEVTLNQFGCKHFGLTTPESIFSFDFRKLGQYFRLVKPEVRPYVMRKLRKKAPLMAALLEPKRTKMAADTLIFAGSHAASHEKLLNVDGKHRHQTGNRRIQIRLDDLTKKFAKYMKKREIYGGEWGSF